MIDNKHPIPLYTIHDIIQPFTWESDLINNYGEYQIDEYVFDSWVKGVKIEAGFYSKHLICALIDRFKIPTSNIKWFIRCRKTLAPDTFKNFLIELFKLFPESQANYQQTVISESWVENVAAKIMVLHVIHQIQLNASGHQLLLKIATSQLTVIRIQIPSKNFFQSESAMLSVYFLTTHQSTDLSYQRLS